MTSLTCPGCGSVTEVERIEKTSDEFCPTCDYPLFWATPASSIALGDGETAEPTLRRLPGTGGRQAVATVACPTCAELNPLDAETCLRCGGPMVLAEPEPEPEPEPEHEPEPEPEVFEAPEHDWRPWAIALVVGMVLVAVLVLVLA